jgi:hypothetical protein
VPSRSLAGIVVPNDQSASIGITISASLVRTPCGARCVVCSALEADGYSIGLRSWK